jgi:hypothetical protein
MKSYIKAIIISFIIGSLAILAIYTLPVSANNLSQPETFVTNQTVKAKPLLLTLNETNDKSKISEPILSEESTIVRRGCCSSHDGVCSCGESNHVVCCDGWTGSSCTCFNFKEDMNDENLVKCNVKSSPKTPISPLVGESG